MHVLDGLRTSLQQDVAPTGAYERQILVNNFADSIPQSTGSTNPDLTLRMIMELWRLLFVDDDVEMFILDMSKCSPSAISYICSLLGSKSELTTIDRILNNELRIEGSLTRPNQRCYLTP